MEKIELNTFENCCKYLGIEPNLPEVSMLPDKHQKAIISNYKLWIISEAWNKEDEFVPDYNDYNQKKYHAWFIMRKAGFRFIDLDYDYLVADAGSGSRLCFATSERAKQFSMQFIELYNDVLLF